MSEYFCYQRQLGFGDLTLCFLLIESFPRSLTCVGGIEGVLHFDADLPLFFTTLSKRSNASEVLFQ